MTRNGYWNYSTPSKNTRLHGISKTSNFNLKLQAKLSRTKKNVLTLYSVGVVRVMVDEVCFFLDCGIRGCRLLFRGTLDFLCNTLPLSIIPNIPTLILLPKQRNSLNSHIWRVNSAGFRGRYSVQVPGWQA
jgi:hypothetical protein